MVKIKNIKKEEKEKFKLKPKEKLLKYLIENKNPQSIMTISGATVIDYKNTYNLVSELQPEIISQEKVGNTNLIKINLKLSPEIYSVESKRTEEFLSKNPKLKVLKNYIDNLNYPFLIVLVFGSYVKNTKAQSSDIDICIISDNRAKIKELEEKFNLLSLKIGIQEFTTKEFVSMIERTQNNLGNEIVKSNIILYGIENYYNLISKWMKKE
jgi:predicted nucleotidyltransferase